MSDNTHTKNTTYKSTVHKSDALLIDHDAHTSMPIERMRRRGEKQLMRRTRKHVVLAAYRNSYVVSPHSVREEAGVDMYQRARAES